MLADGLSDGEIAGIVVGSVAGVGLVAGGAAGYVLKVKKPKAKRVQVSPTPDAQEDIPLDSASPNPV